MKPIRIACKNLCRHLTMSRDASHDYSHHKRVVANVDEIIANTPGIPDKEQNMIVSSAWVHDIVDHKYVHNHVHEQQLLSKIIGCLSLHFGTQDILRIIEWIQGTSYSKEIKLGKLNVKSNDVRFARILADADRLDAIDSTIDEDSGRPLGIQRCWDYVVHLYPEYADDSNFITSKVIEHCDEKLLGLDEWIFTDHAKSMAREHLKVLKEWYYINRKE